jgi:hypothetical protein
MENTRNVHTPTSTVRVDKATLGGGSLFFYQPVSKAKRNPSPLAELKRSGGDQSRSRSEKGVFDRRLLTV